MFSQMPHYRVEKICLENMKFQKYTHAGQNVVLEDMSGDYLYFVKKGSFVSQKAVQVDSLNFWPKKFQQWESTKIEREVLFTANRIQSATYFGEEELLGKTPYGINVCSAERDCELLLISRNDILRVFTEAEIIKIRTLKMI